MEPNAVSGVDMSSVEFETTVPPGAQCQVRRPVVCRLRRCPQRRDHPFPSSILALALPSSLVMLELSDHRTAEARACQRSLGRMTSPEKASTAQPQGAFHMRQDDVAQLGDLGRVRSLVTGAACVPSSAPLGKITSP